MIIEESDFKLIPVNDESPIFDLELLYVIKPKKGEPRKEFKNAGYGLSLKYAIKKIIAYRISSKYPDKTIISLKEYLKNFKEECSKIEKLING